MKRIAIFAPLCVALALMAPGTPESAGQDKGKGQDPKGHGGGAFHPGAPVKAPAPAPPLKVQPPSKVQAPPPVVQRTPAVGSIQPVVKTPAPAPVVKAPPPAVKEDVNAFIERNKGKFTGVGEQHAKQVVPKEVVKTSKVIERPSPKATSAVVQAYHKKLDGKPIVVNNKTVNINNQRNDLVANYQKNWQHRLDTRDERARTIRHELGTSHNHEFTPDWWDRHRTLRSGWWGRYPNFATAWYRHFADRGHWHWWRPPTWVVFNTWLFPGVWAPPIYFDYGGNVVVDNNVVYVEGVPVASEADFYQQALALAQSGAEMLAATPPDESRLEEDWMPLGVFALTNESDGEPTMTLQLAVNKRGVIAGSYFNSLTDEAQPVVGAIDPRTQRAAWYIGGNTTTVFETGAYNLTLPETPVLVHFGPSQWQTWLMVRLPQPAGSGQ